MTGPDLKPTLHPAAARRTRLRGLWILSLLLFAGLYGLTCQRSFSWQDSGVFQLRILEFDLTGWMGLALAHPLLIVLGQVCRLLPDSLLAGGLNFLSGLGMAVALANLAAVIALLTGRRWVGLAVAAMLAVSHTVWWLATITESYTWSVAGLTAELWLLVSLMRKPSWRKAAALGLLSGLGLSLHNFALLPMPGYVIVVFALIARRKLPRWSLATAVVAYLLGAGLYLGLLIDLAVRTGDLSGAISSALFGRFADEVLNVTNTARHAKFNAGIAAMNFVNVLAPLAVIGWLGLRPRLGGPLAAAIGAITLIQITFVVRYPVEDQFTFLLPSLVMIALAAGVGLSVLADASRRWRAAAIAACALSVVLSPVLYAAAPTIVDTCNVSVPRTSRRPFRDEVRYWLVPWKHNENSAAQFAAAALDEASPDGVILSDNTSRPALLLTQSVDDIAEDVDVRDSRSVTELPDDRDAFLTTATTPLNEDLAERVDIDSPPPGAVLHPVTLSP